MILYRNFLTIGGVVHTHSTYATIWAQAAKSIPAFGTTHADYFYGEVPCTRTLKEEEIQGNYEEETGNVIIESFINKEVRHVPSVLVANHGPFSWGKDAHEAVYHATVLEEVAKMALYTSQLKEDGKSIDSVLLDKHFLRKHGSDAYYGQKKIRKDLACAKSSDAGRSFSRSCLEPESVILSDSVKKPQETLSTTTIG